MTVLEAALRDEAALQLLASSSPRRYAREAMRIARASGLVDRARTDPELRRTIGERLHALVREAAAARERGLEEVEAAVLACVVAKLEGPPALDRLDKSVDAALSPWLRALVDRLIAFGPPRKADVDAALEPVRGRADQAVTVARPASAESEQRAA